MMSKAGERYYVLRDEIVLAMRKRAAAAELLPDVHADMPPESWDELIAEGNAAQATEAEEGDDALVAVGSADADLETLKEDSTQVRNAGMKRYKRKNPTLFKVFQAIPVDADADQDILARAVTAAAAWASAPDAATWQPIVGKNLTAFQAEITANQTKQGTRAKETTEAAAARSKRNEMAIKIRDKNVEWYGTAIGAYPENSPQWNIVHGTIDHKDTTGDSGEMEIPPRDVPPGG